MTKAIDNFNLEVDSGHMNAGEIVGIVGPNGIGKTTFIKELLEYYTRTSQNQLQVSYKPQYISSNYEGTVDQLLSSAAEEYSSALFTEQILRPLSINKLLERRILELSGGELQRVAIATCLGKSAHLYLLDEPSAFLDIEERLTVARALRHLVDSLSSLRVCCGTRHSSTGLPGGSHYGLQRITE